MRIDNDELLEYYKRELTYLRRRGVDFARQYPKVAGRLELGLDQSPDPHIERLIESFALLTARIQYDLESEFPRLSAALLGTLYPQLTSPIPSMSIARFEVDPTQGKLTSGHVVGRHTPLYAQTRQGQTCRFRTCYPVELLPVAVSEAVFESTDKYDFLDNMPQVALVLRLRISTLADPLGDLRFDRLRFYLHGDRMLSNALYELLFNHVIHTALLAEAENRPRYLEPDAIQPVGFAPEEAVLPYPANAHPGYRLLQEYFTFPEKFLFFDVQQLADNGSGRFFDILFLLDQMPAGRLTIDPSTFCLGCTPVINLFPKTTDPIRLDETQAEYRIHPDKRREKITEIHSVQTVSASSDRRDTTVVLEPYFSFNHLMAERDHRTFCLFRRQETGRRDLPGTEMFISFVDLDFNLDRPPVKTVYAHTLCTNRHLAEELPPGAILQIEQAAPLSVISILTKPTAQIDPPLEGGTLWRLISHLSLNYLSLSEDENGLKALREILRLYSFTDHSDVHQQIAGIRQMACRRVVRRIGTDAWRGFCKGIEVTLTFDERMYVGSNAFLLAAVLNRFFPLYASINTFTRLIIRSQQREGIWKKWEAMVGDQIVL